MTITAPPRVVDVGEKPRVAATVTSDGKVVPDAEVVFEAGAGVFVSSGKSTGKSVTTGKDGVAREVWSYGAKKFARGYVLAAKVTDRGETARDEVMIRVVEKPE